MKWLNNWSPNVLTLRSSLNDVMPFRRIGVDDFVTRVDPKRDMIAKEWVILAKIALDVLYGIPFTSL